MDDNTQFITAQRLNNCSTKRNHWSNWEPIFYLPVSHSKRKHPKMICLIVYFKSLTHKDTLTDFQPHKFHTSNVLKPFCGKSHEWYIYDLIFTSSRCNQDKFSRTLEAFWHVCWLHTWHTYSIYMYNYCTIYMYIYKYIVKRWWDFWAHLCAFVWL